MFWRFLVLSTAMLVGAAQAAPLPLHRGVGLHQWLNWAPLAEDGTYRWPPYRSVEEWLAEDRPMSDWPQGDPFAAIGALGFDFVRLTVDPGPLLASEGTRREEALAVLSESVQRLTAANLKVVLNLHSVTQVPPPMTLTRSGPAALVEGPADHKGSSMRSFSRKA